MYQEDTKFIDFIAALVAGLMLQYEFWSKPPLRMQEVFTAENVWFALLYMGVCGCAALLVFLWKSRVRRRVGWAFIAILGAGFSTGIHEYFLAQVFAQEPMVLFEGHEFVVLNFIFKLYTTLLVMGTVHFGGVLVREGRRKLRGRYP